MKERGFKRSFKKGVLAVGSAAAVVASSGMAFAENALTTAAATQLGDLNTDTVTIGTIMITVACTLAIAGIIFTVIKKR
jgi:hypothetical protein